MKREKSAASEKVVSAFCDWMKAQDRDVQGAIMRYAQHRHDFKLQGDDLIFANIRDQAEDDDPLMRLGAKVMIHVAMGNKGVGTSFHDRLTAEEAAKILGMSRATFFRKLKDQRFREELGFTGTNTRNGRYSLERTLEMAIHEIPFFRSHSSKQ